jgi:hypothetical protein
MASITTANRTDGHTYGDDHPWAMANHADVDKYIATIPEPLRAIAEAARQVIDADLEDGAAAIRGAHPTWSLGETPVCYLKAASTYITFGFWCTSIDDPSGRLESFAHVMTHVKLRREADVDKNLFANWLRQVRAITAARSD